MPQTEQRFNDLYSDGDVRVLELDGKVTLYEVGRPETWVDAPDQIVVEDVTQRA